jgi:hypothetical protein
MCYKGKIFYFFNVNYLEVLLKYFCEFLNSFTMNQNFKRSRMVHALYLREAEMQAFNDINVMNFKRTEGTKYNM